MNIIHPSADVADCVIGEGTSIWQFVVILEGASTASIKMIADWIHFIF